MQLCITQRREEQESDARWRSYLVEVEGEGDPDTCVTRPVHLLNGQRRHAVVQPGGHEDHGPLLWNHFKVVAHPYIQPSEQCLLLLRIGCEQSGEGEEEVR